MSDREIVQLVRDTNGNVVISLCVSRTVHRGQPLSSSSGEAVVTVARAFVACARNRCDYSIKGICVAINLFTACTSRACVSCSKLRTVLEQFAERHSSRDSNAYALHVIERGAFERTDECGGCFHSNHERLLLACVADRAQLISREMSAHALDISQATLTSYRCRCGRERFRVEVAAAKSVERACCGHDARVASAQANVVVLAVCLAPKKSQSEMVGEIRAARAKRLQPLPRSMLVRYYSALLTATLTITARGRRESVGAHVERYRRQLHRTLIKMLINDM